MVYILQLHGVYERPTLILFITLHKYLQLYFEFVTHRARGVILTLPNSRIIYDVYDNVLTIEVIALGHRKDIYE
ncbi:MAG: type II toxin-antitoxin system RelE family toxin [Cytophagaceae bacterium]